MNLPTFNVPPIGPKQGKLWGNTQLLFAHNSVECHRIQIRKGGYCSNHSHKYKWNRFVLLSGKLRVEVRHGDTLDKTIIDETILTPGQITDVPPGDVHRFEALEDCEALELYWVVLEAGDIDRGGTQGGMK